MLACVLSSSFVKVKNDFSQFLSCCFVFVTIVYCIADWLNNKL